MSTQTGNRSAGKGTILIELNDGTQFSGSFALSLVSGSLKLDTPSLTQTPSAPAELDFSMPLRPFVNEYAENLSGSKKFALLVAHFASGEVDNPVDRSEVIDAWNKMTGLLGGKFNGAHEVRAKDAGYVYVPKAGTVALLKKWRQALA